MPRRRTAPTPTFSPAGGTYPAGQVVKILDSDSNSQIRFTTDGSTPTTTPPGSPVYTGPITLSKSTTLKAIAEDFNVNDSAIATAVYTIGAAPVPPPPPPPAPGPTPTFQDNFANLNNWLVTNGPAFNGGNFSSANVDTSFGLLRLKLSSNGTLAGSVCAEVQSKQKFGYGRYDSVMRASSTSPTPTGAGTPQSGQISACFSFYNDSETEIDAPEIEGQFPAQIEWTNWQTTSKEQATQTKVAFAPEQAFHKYSFIWSPGQIQFLIDDVLVSTHTVNVPSSPAFMLFNLWATNSTDFGGPSTPGDRYMFVRSFAFTAA